jgi:hypothetical protein
MYCNKGKPTSIKWNNKAAIQYISTENNVAVHCLTFRDSYSLQKSTLLTDKILVLEKFKVIALILYFSVMLLDV